MPLSVRLLRSPPRLVSRVVSSSAPEPLAREPPQAQAPTLVLESLLSPGPLFLPLPSLVAVPLPAPRLRPPRLRRRRRLQILTILPIAPTKPLSNRWNLTLSLRERRAVPVRRFSRWREKKDGERQKRQSLEVGTDAR